MKNIEIHNRLRNGALAMTFTAAALAGCAEASSHSSSLEANATNSPAGTIELATPKPSESGATPESSNSPETAVKIETFHLVPGDKFQVLAGDVVIGDVAMNDTEDALTAVYLFDTDTKKAEGKDNTKTGMLVDVKKDGFVLSPYGGDVIRGLEGERKSTWMDLKKAEMINGGCVGGCTDGVDVVEWTGSDTTVTQSGMISEVSSNGATPSESPTLSGVTFDEKKQELLAIMNSEAFEGLTSEDRAKVLLALIECMCAGPVATPEPTPVATPEPTTEAVVCEPMDHVMKPGEKYKLRGPFIVQGDVSIDGKKHYDNSDKTGAIDVITKATTHTIVSPWGADVQSCLTDQQLIDLYKKDLVELRATGRTLDKNGVNQLK